MIAQQLLEQCSQVLGKPIKQVSAVSGGDINEAYLLQCTGDNYFLKYNTGKYAAPLLAAEVEGLNALSPFISTPKIIHFSTSQTTPFLILAYIAPQAPSPFFWENFGRALAHVHRQSQSQFGWDQHNFIGRLPQHNHKHQDWSTFYITERLEPQLKLAMNKHRLPVDYRKYFDQLYTQIPQLCPDEVPALIHGDLWSGNFLVGANDQVLLIDPAIAYAHREMDLAMSRLFGGFAPAFYESYHEAFPLMAGFENRLDIYQLYYLMVHVNLFGGSYVGAVKKILDRYS